jgi:ubiquinone/menaquinone biosynthesis C-methylase UbiE
MKNVISTKSYFAEKAEKYDEVEDQVYWKLSDELLWFQMQKYLNSYRENFTFLDAGGGTGR